MIQAGVIGREGRTRLDMVLSGNFSLNNNQYHVKVSMIGSIQTEQLVPQQQRSCGKMEKHLMM